MLLLQDVNGGNINYLDLAEKWASILESLAVVVSVIYVAIQIKINTKAVKSATYHDIIASFADIETRIGENKELARIFRDGRAGKELEPDEQLRFNQVMSSFFNFHENLYYQHRQGLLDEDLWRGWKAVLARYLSRPGCRAWWEGTAGLYSESFREHVEILKKSTPIAELDILVRTAVPELGDKTISECSSGLKKEPTEKV
jgi:hypothetical protein